MNQNVTTKHQQANTKFRSHWSNEMPRQLSKFDADVWVGGGGGQTDHLKLATTWNGKQSCFEK